MVPAFALLVVLVILTDTVAASTGWPLPGPAIGLAVLVAAFAQLGEPHRGLERLFDLAAPWFPMVFVPAAVGVVAHQELFSAAWLYLGVAIVLGTALTLVVVGLLAQALLSIANRSRSNA